MREGTPLTEGAVGIGAVLDALAEDGHLHGANRAHLIWHGLHRSTEDLCRDTGGGQTP